MKLSKLNLVGSKRAQIDAIYLPILTLFMCFLVIILQKAQEGNIDNSMVSPYFVLNTADAKEIFEKWEEEKIVSSLKNNWGDKLKTKEEFCNNFNNENKKYADFIFSNLIINGQERGDSFSDEISRIDFCNDIYEFDYIGEKLIVERKELKKQIVLKAEDRSKINFIINFDYSFSMKKEFSKE